MANCLLQFAKARLILLQKMIQLPGHSAAPSGVTYSFSAGLVPVWQHEDIHQTMRRADRLMYRAKAEGRARILVEDHKSKD